MKYLTSPRFVIFIFLMSVIDMIVIGFLGIVAVFAATMLFKHFRPQSDMQRIAMTVALSSIAVAVAGPLLAFVGIGAALLVSQQLIKESTQTA